MAYQLLANKGARWVGLGWTAFILENLVLSHNRSDIIAWYGDDNYHMVYNVLSTAACSSIAYGFFKHGHTGGAALPRRGLAVQLLAVLVQGIGLAGLSQMAPALQNPIGMKDAKASAEVTPGGGASQAAAGAAAAESKFYMRCPMDFRPKGSTGAISGTDRVSRHPALWCFGLTALGSAMTTGTSATTTAAATTITTTHTLPPSLCTPLSTSLLSLCSH
jgi:hypothetical protein